MMKPAQHCPACKSLMHLERLRCPTCQTVVEGRFAWPRLSRLSETDQELVELLVLASGNLKTVAEKLGVSYPTVRKRVDLLITHLTDEVKADDAFRRQLLRDVASGKRSAGDVTRLLKPEHGGAHGRT